MLQCQQRPPSQCATSRRYPVPLHLWHVFVVMSINISDRLRVSTLGEKIFRQSKKRASIPVTADAERASSTTHTARLSGQQTATPATIGDSQTDRHHGHETRAPTNGRDSSRIRNGSEIESAVSRRVSRYVARTVSRASRADMRPHPGRRRLTGDRTLALTVGCSVSSDATA